MLDILSNRFSERKNEKKWNKNIHFFEKMNILDYKVDDFYIILYHIYLENESIFQQNRMAKCNGRD